MYVEKLPQFVLSFVGNTNNYNIRLLPSIYSLPSRVESRCRRSLGRTETRSLSSEPMCQVRSQPSRLWFHRPRAPCRPRGSQKAAQGCEMCSDLWRKSRIWADGEQRLNNLGKEDIVTMLEIFVGHVWWVDWSVEHWLSRLYQGGKGLVSKGAGTLWSTGK